MAATAAVRIAVIQRASDRLHSAVVLSFITMIPHVTGNPFTIFRISATHLFLNIVFSANTTASR